MKPTPLFIVRTTVCNMTKELKMYCREQGYGIPKFWPASYTKDYAVSLHMTGDDQWEEFDANVVFLLGEHGKNETQLLRHLLEKLQEPVALIVLAESVNNQNIYKSLGFTLIPARLTNKNQEEYEVYAKGLIKMGGFVNLLEKVESIGSYDVTIKRSPFVITFSFISFIILNLLRKIVKMTGTSRHQ